MFKEIKAIIKFILKRRKEISLFIFFSLLVFVIIASDIYPSSKFLEIAAKLLEIGMGGFLGALFSDK